MTTITRSWTILCPEWCSSEQSTGHEPWAGGDGELHVDHQGPDFGENFHTNGAQVADVVTPEVIINEREGADGDIMSAGQLRELAADALAAAEWLEAQA